MTVLDLSNCNLACLDADAFVFPGARAVTHVDIGFNDLEALPERLLWNMTSLVSFRAEYLKKLETLPEGFFQHQRRLTGMCVERTYSGNP